MMDDPILAQFPDSFVDPLIASADAPEPQPAFVANLEQRLLQQQQGVVQTGRQSVANRPWIHFPLLHTLSGLLLGTRARLFPYFSVRRWQFAVIFLILILTTALFVIGPQRVLAQVQRWLNYVPGIGFINLSETQVLPSPVQMRRGSITLQIDQVVAGPERTQVVFTMPGFSEQDLSAAQKNANQSGFTAFLVLPDGSRLEPVRWELWYGSASLEYQALPAGVRQVTLLLPRLPLVSAGALPEDWEIPLTLVPAGGQAANNLFPQPYQPAHAETTVNGITLRVLDVAQMAEETAIRYQVEWPDPAWQFRGNYSINRMPELQDDLGHVYWESIGRQSSSVAAVMDSPSVDFTQAAPTPTPDHPYQIGTLVFPALSLSASQATLWLDSFGFIINAEGTVTLDLGAHQTVGNAWPLDAVLEVAGYTVHITGARLREETVHMGNGQQEDRAYIELTVEPWQDQNGFTLASIQLVHPEKNIYGSIGQQIHNGTIHYQGRLYIPDGKTPVGRVTLSVTNAELIAKGPWSVTWNIPGKDATKVAQPLRFAPKSPAESGTGVQPIAEEVFLSDRLSAVKLNGTGLPAGATFVQAYGYDPATFDPSRTAAGLYLEDQWGRRYDAGRNEVFIRPDKNLPGFSTDWTFFPPLAPLAQTVHLHVPGIEVYLPGSASFEIEVPQGVNFKAEEYPVVGYSNGGATQQTTMTRWVTDPWTVDIAFEIAGFRLQFTEAQIERNEQSDPVYTLALNGDPMIQDPAKQDLVRLRFSETVRPDGETVPIDPESEKSGLLNFPYGAVGPEQPGSTQVRAGILMDVTAANQVDLLSGWYQVTLNGVTIWVPGPWDIPILPAGR